MINTITGRLDRCAARKQVVIAQTRRRRKHMHDAPQGPLAHRQLLPVYAVSPTRVFEESWLYV